MNSRLVSALAIVAVAFLMSGCKQRDKDAAVSSAAIDNCMVGTWKSTEATLNLQLAHASGGANVEMKIEPSGACAIDFTPMSEINATFKPMNFNFHYVGKATGRLTTPGAGVIAVAQMDYSRLRVNATLQAQGRGAMPFLTNMPVTRMAPTVAGGANPGVKSPPSGTAQGIDSSPVLSADSYTCSSTTLTLTSSVAYTQWTFSRISKPVG